MLSKKSSNLNFRGSAMAMPIRSAAAPSFSRNMNFESCALPMNVGAALNFSANTSIKKDSSNF